MKIKLLSLTLKNFKGIKILTINSNGQNLSIYGDNATGKTTIFDAFNWLLFDKDSNNQSNFSIKPYEINGEETHGIESEVEAILECDDRELAIKKVYYEKWTKQRGNATAKFSGNTTDYFINDVPRRKSEYNAKIEQLMPEGIFRLLTNSLHFNESTKWSERRKILIEVCGDVADSEVIDVNVKLAKLLEIVSNRSISEHIKVIKTRQTKINEELKKIPIRISEVTLSMSALNNQNLNTITQNIERLQAVRTEKQQEFISLQNGGGIAEKQKQLATAQTQLIKLKNAHEEKKQAVLKEILIKIDVSAMQYKKLLLDADIKKNEVDSSKAYVAKLESRIQELRKKWGEINALKFQNGGICLACGQSLSSEEAESKFNLNKSQKLEKINTEGKELRTERDGRQQKITQLESEYEDLKEQALMIKTEYKNAVNEAEKVRINFSSIEGTKNYIELSAQLLEIQSDIEKLKHGNLEQVTKLQQEITDTDNAIQILQSEVAKIEQSKKAKARIEELKVEEKALATEYEKLEEELYLAEEFTRTKVSMLTDKINSKFKLARFKLFDTQVNGGIVDCCETTCQGVPYSDLNNAAKINVGLDIINTLSEHYEFNAPTFVDNAESVTQLIETKAQVVRLVVSEQDKNLRVEVD